MKLNYEKNECMCRIQCKKKKISDLEIRGVEYIYDSHGGHPVCLCFSL